MPGCGHKLGADGALEPPPTPADAATLGRIAKQMGSLSVAVTPVVSADSAALHAVLASPAAVAKFAAAVDHAVEAGGHD